MKTPSAREQPSEQDEQIVELLRGEVLRDRMQHHDVDRPGGSAAISSGARTSIFGLLPKRRASAARTIGAASHRIRRRAVSATRSACSASPQP
jgi:hypothetical protein